MTEKNFLILGCKQTLHSCLDLIDDLIDDTVATNVNLISLCAVKSVSVGTNVKAADDSIRCCRKHNVALGNTADCRVNYRNLNFLIGKLKKRCLNRLNRACNVSLNNNIKRLNACRDLTEELVKVNSGVSRKNFLTESFSSLLRKVLRHSLVLNRIKLIACLRNVIKTDDLNGNGRTCSLYGLTLIVNHRTNSTNRVTYDNVVALMESTVLNEYGCNGAASLIKLRLDNETCRAALGISTKLLNLGYEKHVLKKVINTHLGVRRNGNANYVAAPSLGNKLILCKLVKHVIGISRRLIHLINSYYNINSCRLSVVDCLNGLGHNAVVCRNNEDRDIGGLRTSHTHCGERLVTGGIKEGNVLALCLNSVSTDRLSNTARLAASYVCVSDSVKNRGLTVVNVTHNANYGCALDEILLGILCLGKELLLDRNHNLLGNLNAEFISDKLGCAVIDNVVETLHLAHKHKLLDDLSSGLLHSGCKLGNGDLVGNGDLKLLVSCALGFHSLDLFLRCSLLILGRLLILTAVILLLQLLLLCLGIAAVKDRIVVIVVSVVVLGKVNVAGSRINDTGLGRCLINVLNANVYSALNVLIYGRSNGLELLLLRLLLFLPGLGLSYGSCLNLLRLCLLLLKSSLLCRKNSCLLRLCLCYGSGCCNRLLFGLCRRLLLLGLLPLGIGVTKTLRLSVHIVELLCKRILLGSGGILIEAALSVVACGTLITSVALTVLILLGLALVILLRSCLGSLLGSCLGSLGCGSSLDLCLGLGLCLGLCFNLRLSLNLRLCFNLKLGLRLCLLRRLLLLLLGYNADLGATVTVCVNVLDLIFRCKMSEEKLKLVLVGASAALLLNTDLLKGIENFLGLYVEIF